MIAFTFGSARGISSRAADWLVAKSLLRSNMESRVVIVRSPPSQEILGEDSRIHVFCSQERLRLAEDDADGRGARQGCPTARFARPVTEPSHYCCKQAFTLIEKPARTGSISEMAMLPQQLS